MRKKKALVDGDEIIYKACKAAEEDLPVGDHHYRHADFGKCKAIVQDQLYGVEDATGITEFEMALSDQSGANFRKDYNPEYKSNRDPSAKPLCFHRIVEWVRSKWTCHEYPSLEADDVLGILSGDFDLIVATDKDMKTLPATTYSPLHNETYSHGIEEADWYFLVQTLAGDRVDGYPGCPGVGSTTAPRILEAAVGANGRIPQGQFDAAWAAVEATYEKKGAPGEALLNARMARILRPGEWSPDGGAQLWAPVVVNIDG